jgi:trans-aconitate methyltransferase
VDRSGIARDRKFIPAAPGLWLYNVLVAASRRELRWRGLLSKQIAVCHGDVIADVGCGSAAQLKRMAKIAPTATLIGIDPDLDVLQHARRKVASTRATVELKIGFARDTALLLKDRRVNKIISSLVFHRVSLAEKRAGLTSMLQALVPGGELHIADYGLQRTPLMRRLFRIVQSARGFENSEQNAQGILPELMREVGFDDVRETAFIRTPTGSMSIYYARRRR